ncbi:MAG: flavoprotein [Actinophytocola sp.]|uniref:flavoprotein n=1 Tax=Actinophytocola sp. TaxID=1872138 RepID=UPI003D6B1BD7
MTTQVLHLVVCAAPPAQAVDELVGLLQNKNWTVCVIATPRATGWMDIEALARQTGNPVRDEYQGPDSESLPRADAIAVAPATFNTVNKWVAGISDTFALGLLNEAIGLRLPIVVAPYAKASLAAHPAYARSLQTLGEWGVTVLPNEVIRVGAARDVFGWGPVVDALDRV